MPGKLTIINDVNVVEIVLVDCEKNAIHIATGRSMQLGCLNARLHGKLKTERIICSRKERSLTGIHQNVIPVAGSFGTVAGSIWICPNTTGGVWHVVEPSVAAVCSVSVM